MSDGVQKAIDDFKEATRYDLSRLLTAVSTFLRQDAPKIQAYYAGKAATQDQSSFDNLNLISVEVGKVLQLFRANKARFRYYYHWELLDNVEQLNIKLLTISNLSKWLRSTRTKNNFSQGTQAKYTLPSKTLLDNVDRRELEGQDSLNDWQAIAMLNGLREEDYDSAGGNQLILPLGGATSQYTSFVDNPIEDRVLGKDLKRKLEFDVATSDLVTLSPPATAHQSAEILSSLTKGSIPEYPDLGFEEDLVGSNKATFNFPTVQRQLREAFATDDSFINFILNTYTAEQDNVFIDFQVSTIYGEQLGPNQKIQ